MVSNDGAGLHMIDNHGASNNIQFGPGIFVNCLWFDNAGNATGSNFAHEIIVEYRSGNTATPHWSDALQLHYCAFPSGVTFHFNDKDGGGWETARSLSYLESNYPNSFSNNIEVATPNFVDGAVPRVAKQTVYNISQLRAIYENFETQETALHDVGGEVTLVNGQVSASPTVVVDEGKWFRDIYLDSAFSKPEEIFIAGHGAVTITARSGNTLTVDENVTCADNAKVYFGDTATPNIGWWQGAGMY